jgi:hypothetical protein
MARSEKISLTKWIAVAALMQVALAAMGPLARAEDPASCAKAEFEDAVDEAAAALRELNNKHRPEFQEKLRQLKDKRGWSNDQFMKEAAPFVKDDQIDVYDDTTNDLLAKITEMGQEGAAAKTPDCAMLSELRDHMDELVGTQTRKWTYMFEKLDKELAK